MQGFLQKDKTYTVARVYPYGGYKIKAAGLQDVKKLSMAKKLALQSLPDETTKIQTNKELEEFVNDAYVTKPPRFPVLLFSGEFCQQIIYLPTYCTYLPIYLLYLPTNLPTYLSTYLPTVPTYQSTYLLYLPTYLPTVPIYLPTYLPPYLPTYLQYLPTVPTNLPTYCTYLHTYLPTYLPTYSTYRRCMCL